MPVQSNSPFCHLKSYENAASFLDQACTGCYCCGWHIANLTGISNEPVSGQEILPEINKRVAAVDNQHVYIRKVIDVDDSDAHITFYQHSGDITSTTVFHFPKHKDEVWVSLEDIICILPKPNDTKHGKKFDKAVIEAIAQRFSQWKGFP